MVRMWVTVIVTVIVTVRVSVIVSASITVIVRVSHVLRLGWVRVRIGGLEQDYGYGCG